MMIDYMVMHHMIDLHGDHADSLARLATHACTGINALYAQLTAAQECH